jgi:hypothetical protein
MADVPEMVQPEAVRLLFRKFKHPLKRKFLRAFSEIGMIGKACEAAGIYRDLHYSWLYNDESYAQAFEQARQIAGDKAEDEVYRRGIEGFEHPVIYEGRITTTYKAYSDNLAMFFLKGLRPEKYRDNQAGITFQGPVDIQVNILQAGEKLNPPSLPQIDTDDEQKD